MKIYLVMGDFYDGVIPMYYAVFSTFEKAEAASRKYSKHGATIQELILDQEKDTDQVRIWQMEFESEFKETTHNV